MQFYKSDVFLLDNLAPTLTTSPEPVDSGASLSLTCTANSEPAPSTYTFYHGSTEIASQGTNLYTFTVDETHGGSYKCKATNTFGTSSDSAAVDVTVDCK